MAKSVLPVFAQEVILDSCMGEQYCRAALLTTSIHRISVRIHATLCRRSSYSAYTSCLQNITCHNYLGAPRSAMLAFLMSAAGSV